MAAQKLFVDMVDNIVIGKSGNTELIQTLKDAFGMPNVTHIPDFTNQLASGVGWWQSLNWDPEVSYPVNIVPASTSDVQILSNTLTHDIFPIVGLLPILRQYHQHRRPLPSHRV